MVHPLMQISSHFLEGPTTQLLQGSSLRISPNYLSPLYQNQFNINLFVPPALAKIVIVSSLRSLSLAGLALAPPATPASRPTGGTCRARGGLPLAEGGRPGGEGDARTRRGPTGLAGGWGDKPAIKRVKREREREREAKGGDGGGERALLGEATEPTSPPPSLPPLNVVYVGPGWKLPTISPNSPKCQTPKLSWFREPSCGVPVERGDEEEKEEEEEGRGEEGAYREKEGDERRGGASLKPSFGQGWPCRGSLQSWAFEVCGSAV